jgi:PAS domain S-box-containing protein
MKTPGNAQSIDYAYLMLEHLPMGVALLDADDFTLLSANTTYFQIHEGYLDAIRRNESIIGHSIIDWLPERATQKLVAASQAIRATGIYYKTDEEIFPSSVRGLTYWNWSLSPIRDSEGRISHLLLAFSEVTSQVLARHHLEMAHASLNQTNQAVEAERKRLEVIETVARSVRESLDTESIGHAAIDAISSHFNAMRVCIHVAHSEQEELRLLCIKTAPGVEYLPEIIDAVPYSSSLPIGQTHKRRSPIITEDLQATITAASSVPLPLVNVHGYVCVPLWFKDRFEGTLTAMFRNPIQPDGVEVQTLVGCSLHIAVALAHARLHEAVENEHARLQAVLDQLPEGVLLIEASGQRISYANAAAAHILGVPVAQIGMLPTSNQYPASFSIHNSNDQRIAPEDYIYVHALHGKTISGQEIFLTRPDGTRAVVLASATPIRAENNVILEAVVVFQDITERKSIEQHKNEFVSIASHELRTPITAIQGFAELLEIFLSQDDNQASQRSLQAIKSIMEQSQRLTRLIEAMLDLSRIENVQLLINPAVHDLLDTITHAVKTQAITSKRHTIRLTLDRLQPGDRLMAYYDEDRIDQVLNNLISNATKYSPPGSEIEVGLSFIEKKSRQALIWVKDQGVGIASSELPHIFKRFHRASKFDRTISGLGIGLYLVHELVTRHGGKVWVESIENHGSIFYVTLPLFAAQI